MRRNQEHPIPTLPFALGEKQLREHNAMAAAIRVGQLRGQPTCFGDLGDPEPSATLDERIADALDDEEHQ